ncbi:MAG TPA: hypothetical protein VND92_08320, partial [Vicinamibacterales bacterium]|nr:hypothetical protein [Vicinamibacterales bacterium]
MVTLARSRGPQRARTGRGRVTRVVALLGFVGVLLFVSGCRTLSFQLYEYEEDVYLSLDGSATVYVSGSAAALDALRGFDLSTDPATPLDRTRIRALYTSPVAQVAQVTTSLRDGRRFVHVRLDVPDIRQLSSAAPFDWARYDFHQDGNQYVYREEVGASADRKVGHVGWTGQEMVAFRLHLPSVITYHNAGPDNLLRGNVLRWQQRLDARLAG